MGRREGVGGPFVKIIKETYNPGALPYVNLGYVKQLCDNYNVQINFIFNPDHLQIRIYRIDPRDGTLSKSEKISYKNSDLMMSFTPSTLEMIIRNVLSDWYPSTMLST
jgi:hypothetical protein